MDFSRFSKKDLQDALEIIQDALLCREEAGLEALIARVRVLVSKDDSVCAVMRSCDEGIQAVRLYNQNHYREWLEHYARNHIAARDPVLHTVLETSTTHEWRGAPALRRGDIYSGFFETATGFGLKEGLASGVREEKNISFFSFGGKKDPRSTEREKAILNLLVPHMHQALFRVFDAHRETGAALSVKEREILRWMKEGKTGWEISVILSISERTVKYHLMNIQYKLKAINKSHAIAIAMEQGL